MCSAVATSDWLEYSQDDGANARNIDDVTSCFTFNLKISGSLRLLLFHPFGFKRMPVILEKQNGSCSAVWMVLTEVRRVHMRKI